MRSLRGTEQVKSMSSTPLFRPEAVAAQRDRVFGNLLIVWPFSLRILTAVAACIVISIVSFLICSEYTRKARLVGYVAPTGGFVRVFPSAAGTITERRVSEGTHVKAGETLYLISSERGTATGHKVGQTAKEEMVRRRETIVEDIQRAVELGQVQKSQLSTRINDLNAQMRELDRQRMLQQRRLSTFQDTSSQFRRLQAQGFVSSAQLQQQVGLELEQEVALQAIEVSRATVTRELRAAQSQLPEVVLRSQSEQASLIRSLSNLDQELTDVEGRIEFAVICPVSGVVTAIRGDIGQQAVPSAALLNILPTESGPEVQLLAPPSTIGLIEVGNEVLLRYTAYPYQKFGHGKGLITSISKSPLNPNDLPFPNLTNEATFLISVTLQQPSIAWAGRNYPLHPGMTVEADVPVETRRIYEWILDPLYVLFGRL